MAAAAARWPDGPRPGPGPPAGLRELELEDSDNLTRDLSLPGWHAGRGRRRCRRRPLGPAPGSECRRDSDGHREGHSGGVTVTSRDAGIVLSISRTVKVTVTVARRPAATMQFEV